MLIKLEPFRLQRLAFFVHLTLALGQAHHGATTVAAVDRRVGELVFTRNPGTGKTEIKRVTKLSVHPVYEVYHLELADSKTGKIVERIGVTSEHPFYVEGKGFVPVKSLGIGTSIVTRAGPALIVNKLTSETIKGGVSVYNFTVEGDHTYFVGNANGGVWVHNTCPASGRPFAHNGQLNTNIIEQMFKGKWVNGEWVSVDNFFGGTAGAVRREISTGAAVGGKFHSIKAESMLGGLKNILRTGKFKGTPLDSFDMDIVRELHDDLLSAIQGK